MFCVDGDSLCDQGIGLREGYHPGGILSSCWFSAGSERAKVFLTFAQNLKIKKIKNGSDDIFLKKRN